MNYLLATLFSICTLSCFSQIFPVQDYPRDYFRDPLDIPIALAANFGELRANHYHMGLDIRTRQRVNLPVFAAADGYIAHVKIEPGGFGQAIYICHPNGYTTLYAHLNKFFPALAAYVGKQQYRLESWQVFLDIPPGLFPVKKGDFIAYSGSTGGSEGPHLHFEIRRTSDDMNLNPLLFGLPVPDSTDPVIVSLAVYDRDRSVYEQAPLMIPVRKVPGAIPASGSGTAADASYSIGSAPVKVASPKVSFALSAYDTQSGSANPNGIFQALLFEDEQPIIGFRMDHISYDHTRDINAHIDYRTREKGGPFLQHLSRLPGYSPPSIYESFRNGPGADGVIDLSDGKLHQVRIEVKDAYGNASLLSYEVQYQQLLRGSVISPDSDKDVKEFYPGMLDGSETGDCAFYIPEKGLYDPAHIRDVVAGGSPADPGPSLPGGVSAVHSIGFPWIPLQTAMLVRLRPRKELSGGARDKTVMVRWAGDKKDVERPEWKGGWASARYREFGNFELVEDEEAPVIKPIGFRDGANLSKSSRIAFTVKDNLGAIRDCRAELDGKWLCFTNDKGLAYIYIFDEHCPAGKHVLKITAGDEAGNKTIKEYRFTR